MQLWGGRFSEEPDQTAAAFTLSLAFDRRLWPYDIQGSVAHVKMLAQQGIIGLGDEEAIINGLETIRQELEEERFPFRDEYEDIHLNIEARLNELIGETAGKVHTARSRNDQVAVDIRLFARDAFQRTLRTIYDLQGSLLVQAEAHLTTILPGYTHLQRAQPVVLAHHLLAYVAMLERDAGRLHDALERADELPLGSGALAGVPYPIDRAFVARQLGFSRISDNSLDAVSDRDFLVEYEAAAALIMVHCSRLAEEIVLWSSAEFGFVDLPEAFASGSSIMPQKKNPDTAELVRGKVGRVVGHLVSLLTTLKGLPLAYNRDLQEDKESFFDTVDTTVASLGVLAALVRGLRFRGERMRRAAEDGFLLATDLADYLVARGLPFREAHQQVGKLVRYAQEHGKTFADLTLEEFHRISPLVDEDVRRLTLEESVAARRSLGGTAPTTVAVALRRARARWRRHAR